MSESSDPSTLHAKQTLKSINNLRKRGFICDFTIKVDNESFPVHRTVLAACSDYFQAMFSHKTKEVQQGVVDMKDVDAGAVKQCVEFMYTGQATVDIDNAKDVLHASGIMQLTTLSELCFERLKTMVTTENCFSIKALALKYLSPELEKVVDEFILANLDAALNDKEFVLLQQKDIVKYVSSCRDHLLAWEALMTWIKHEEEPRMGNIESMMKEMNFTAFPFDFLLEMITTDDVIKESDAATSVLVKILSEKLESDISVISVENCLKVKLLLSEVLTEKSENAEKYLEDFAAKHFYDIQWQEEFLKLQETNVIKYLESPFTVSISEITKWKAVLRWVRYDPERRDGEFPKLFRYLRLNNLPTSFIQNAILSEPLVKDSHQCKDILIEALCLSRKVKNPWIVLINRNDYRTTLFHAETKQPFWQNSDVKIPVWNKKPVIKFGLDEPSPTTVKAVVMGDDIYCIVGDVLYCLEIQSRQNWFQIARLEDKIEEEAQLCVCGNRIYSIGKEIISFDVTQNKWIKTNRRYESILHHCVVGFEGTIYVIGGNKKYHLKSDLLGRGVAEKFASGTSSWATRPFMAQPNKKHRIKASACEFHGLIYVLGGKSTTVEFYNPTCNVWTLVSDLKIEREQCYSGVLGGKLYVLGGNSLTEVYNEEKDKWIVDDELNVGSNLSLCVELD